MPVTYEQAVQRLLWLGHEGRSLKWDLTNISAVLERLGHPERAFRSIHIAGTNGKGSVAAMLDSVLRAAGLRTGLYTSPHLVCMNERLAVNARPASAAEFAAAFNAVTEAIEALLAANALPNPPSYFETLTAMAFWHFAEAGVEAAVVEVGLGGRLDATNVLTPAVTVITAIDFDHERHLGHSIERIAAEKAGIVKPGVPVINAAAHPVARRVVGERARAVGPSIPLPSASLRAGEASAPLVEVATAYRVEQVRSGDFGRYEFLLRGADGFELWLAPGLRGAFQVDNATTAAAAARELQRRGWKLPLGIIAEGIAAAQWPGRMELVQYRPLVFLDGAHNPAGARQVARFWAEHLAGRRIHLVYGTVRDKAVAEIAELLFPPAATVIVTQPPTPRAAGADTLARLARAANPSVVVELDAARALERALEMAGPEDAVFVTGSLFLVGDCREALTRQAAPVPCAAVPAARAAS